MSFVKKREGVNKGATILEEHPFAFVLKSSERQLRCDHCFAKSELLTCTGCNEIRYCDRMCQKKGWYFHQRECRNMKRIAPRILPDAARLLARIIFKLDKGGAREQGFYSSRQFRVFMDLMSHYNEVKVDKKRMEHFESLRQVLLVFFGDAILPNPVELLQIFGKMVINTFCILDDEMQPIGSGLYLAASIIDHSCNSNAIAVFNGISLLIRTLVDMEFLDWSKITISYVDRLNFPEVRQKDLQETYYFLCQCDRCMDVEELGIMNATICQNENCRKTIIHGTENSKIKCTACDEQVDAITWEKINEGLQFTDEQLNLMKNDNVAYVDICRLCLNKQDGLLDSMNLRRVKVLDTAMDSCIQLGLWESALGYGQQLVAPFTRYYGSNHPITGILLLKLCKIALYLEQTTPARNYLKQAGAILFLTHGKNHPLVRDELLSYSRQCNY